MPTERLITILTQEKGSLRGVTPFAKLDAAVQALIPQYDLLFNHTEQFTDENPVMGTDGC
jgi:hypothetical protein